MQAMTIHEQSFLIGKSKSYFSVQKKHRTQLWRYINLVSPRSLVQGYEIFKSCVEEAKQEASIIHYSFNTDTDFANWLFEKKISSSVASARHFINRGLYSTRSMRFTTLKKMRSIIKLYNKDNIKGKQNGSI